MTDLQKFFELLAKTPDIEKALENTAFRIKAKNIRFNTYEKTITIAVEDLISIEFASGDKE